MNAMGEGTGWRGAPGWIKLLLIVSLSVNVAVVGLVAGTAAREEQGEFFGSKGENEPGLDRRQSRILQIVPNQRREEARAILLSRQDEYMAAREAMSLAQMALVDAIRRDPFDPAALASALASRQAASARVWGIGYEQLAEIAARLSADERAELANRLEERTKRWVARLEGTR